MGTEPKESSYELLKTERYLWIARAFSVVAVLAALANILLLVALGSLQPLVRIQPFMLNIQDKDQQVIEIVRPKLEDLNLRELTESFIRQYITARYTVGSDLEELERRWGMGGIVKWMSTAQVYDEFVSREKKALNSAQEGGMTRDIRIESVMPTGKKDQTGEEWKVRFQATTMRQASAAPDVRHMTVKLNAKFQGESGVPWADRLQNPLGFKVTRYGNN